MDLSITLPWHSFVGQKLVDVDMFTDIHRIELALGRHSCAEALTWCNENKAALRKLKVSDVGILVNFGVNLCDRAH